MRLLRRRTRPTTSIGISQAQNDLGLRLLSRLARDQPDGNLVLSPSGLTLALAAAYLGAHGETQRDLGRVLGHPASGAPSEEELEAWRRSLRDQEAEVSMTIAASVWLPSGSSLMPAYADRLHRSLDAETSVLSRDEATAVEQINQWASRSTRGRITQVLARMDPAALMMLLTVVDFHAKWQIAFDPGNTREEPFHLAPGRLVPHPLMRRSGDFHHFHTAEFEGVALPYAGGPWRMIILLPSADRSLDNSLAQIDGKKWNNLAGRLRMEPGTIALPRFQLLERMMLAGPLTELGLGRVFDLDLADFRNLESARSASAMSQLCQTARLEVDEEGTEASAVTLMVQVVAWPPPRWTPFEMRVDRPFIFAIEDRPSSTLLFLGAVRDPRRPERRAQENPSALPVPPGTPPEIRRLTSR